MSPKADSEKEYPCHCYGVRRLNPFLGVMQVLATTDSRAISPDGYNWQIQILADKPDDMWGAPSNGRTAREYLRFGTWSRDKGLRQIPANPLLDLSTMLERAGQLLKLLEKHHHRVPFPLEDRFELWLLDRESRMPLALLASRTGTEELEQPISRHWYCTHRREPDFPSPDWERLRPQRPRDNNPHVSALEQLVGTRSSDMPSLWFERDRQGMGRTIANTPDEERRELPAAAFPERLLKTDLGSEDEDSLVADYLAWSAPYLLTLPLTDETRALCEQQAVKRALLVADLWQLYPKIVDTAAINAARVEARLRRSADPRAS